MLVSPDDELDRIIEHAFGDELLGPMLDTWLVSIGSVGPNPPILVDQKDVEPVVFGNLSAFGHVHLDAIRPQLIVHALVLDVADAVEGKVGVTLAEQDGTNLDPLILGLIGFVGREIDFAKVVQNAGHGQDVEGTQRSFLGRLASFNVVNSLVRCPGGRRGCRGWRRRGWQC